MPNLDELISDARDLADSYDGSRYAQYMLSSLADALEAAEAERDAAVAAIERVREQHIGKDHYEPVDPGFPPYTWAIKKSGKRCYVCEETWPCPTIAALGEERV